MLEMWQLFLPREESTIIGTILCYFAVTFRKAKKVIDEKFFCRDFKQKLKNEPLKSLGWVSHWLI